MDRSSEMPTTKEELETFIKEYITNNLSIGVYVDKCCDDKRINVSVILGEEEIAYASEYL